MGLHWQFGVVQSGAVASVSAVSDIYSEDDNGTGASGYGNSKITVTVGSGSPTNNVDVTRPIGVSAGTSVKLGFNGAWTGTETSIAWSVTLLDPGLGLVTGVSPTSGTSAGFDPVFTIDANANAGEPPAVYRITIAVTNSGGTTSENFDTVIEPV
tara:strand:+ start:430 stop:894 length:465 start_codon:yes stop_codon:yes gene_type:complete